MVSVLDSGSSGLGSSPGCGHCVVFLGKTLYSLNVSLHRGLPCDGLASLPGGSSSTPSRLMLRKPGLSAGPMGHLGLYKGFTFTLLWIPCRLMPSTLKSVLTNLVKRNLWISRYRLQMKGYNTVLFVTCMVNFILLWGLISIHTNALWHEQV